MMTQKFIKYKKEDVDQYCNLGYWRGITLGELIDKAMASFPFKEAVVDDKVRLTYDELHKIVVKLAIAFIKLGINKGNTVLIQLPNWVEFIYSYFALQKIGAIPVLLISGYKFLEVSHLCQLTEAVAWIVPQAYRNIEYASFISKVKNNNKQLRHVISVRADRQQRDFTASLERLLETRFAASEEQRLLRRQPKPTDVAHIIPSGGTTGLPKGIPRTHNDYICNIEYQHKVASMNTGDVCLIAVPVGHNLGLLNVTGSMFHYYKLVLLDSTRPADILRSIQQEKITYMPTVPSLLKRIVDFDKLSDYDLSSLKKICAGGEVSPPELINKAIATLRCKYINEFGMSEGILCRTKLDYKIETICNTVGQPCCPHDKVKIIDDLGHEVLKNVNGEMVTKGPGIFAGYLKNPEENRKSFTIDGFFRTGDLANIDSEGNLKITGRIKDIIIRGGENISPSQIEELLSKHPDIDDAAVIGMPDKELGEKVCAYVKLKEGVKVDPEEIKLFMENEGASKLIIPERFEFVEVLPMTDAGKHDKKALRDDIRQRLA